MTNYDEGTTLSVKTAIRLLISMEKANGGIFTQNEKIALSMVISALEKEKEPAPQEAETSSSKNNSIDNNNTRLKICQEIIGRNIEQLVIYHDQLSDAEKRQYVDLCFVEKVIKEIVNETEKDH